MMLPPFTGHIAHKFSTVAALFLVTTTLQAAPVSEVMTYASTFPASVGGPQPVSLKAELNYDDSVTNAPIAVVMHQFSQSSGNFADYRANAQRLRDRGFFTITPGMRGRDGSDGSRDTGGREIHDIYDAVQAAIAANPGLTDANYVYITGYSGGGGNVMSSLTKFPDRWNAASSFFGISDYGFHPSNGWYFNGSSGSHRGIMDTDIGDPTSGTPAILDKYRARASNLSSKNNPYAEIHLFVNDDETLVPPVNHITYRDNAVAAEGFPGEFANITHHLGSAGLYQDFNNDTLNTPDELQYWPHQAPTADQQASAERWFIDRMVSKQIPPPVLNDSDELHVAGYVVMKPFALYLDDGQNAAGNLTYAKTANGWQFDLDVFTSNASIPTLLRIDASGSAGKLVDIFLDGNLVESIAGGDWIETEALTDATSVSVVFTDRDAPAPVIPIPVFPGPPVPLAHWRFESAGTLFTDSGSGNYTLATVGTAPIFTALSTGKPGGNYPSPIPLTETTNTGAASFTGAGYFSASNNPALQPASFTVEAFASVQALAAGTRYIASRNVLSGNNRAWGLGIGGTNASTSFSPGELFLVTSQSGDDPILTRSGFILQTGIDYYVAFSFAPGKPITFHFKDLTNGTPLTTLNIASPSNTLFLSTADFLIGSNNNSTGSSWSGTIDEVRICPGVLAKSQLLLSTGLTYQEWADLSFNATEQLDPDIGTPNADPDHDGLTNLAEFGGGTYPRHFTSSQKTLEITSTHARVTVPSVRSPDLISQAYSSPNLSAWTPFPTESLVETATDGFISMKTYEFPLPTEPGAEPKLFFRSSYEFAP